MSTRVRATATEVVPAGLLDPKQLWRSTPDALRKLDPRTLYKNPVMFLVEAEELLRTFVNPLRVKSPEFSVRTRVAKIKSELPRLHLDRHGIR